MGRFRDEVVIEDSSGIWEDDVEVEGSGRAAARAYMERMRDGDWYDEPIGGVESVAVIRHDLDFGVEQPLFTWDRGTGIAEDFEPEWPEDEDSD